MVLTLHIYNKQNISMHMCMMCVCTQLDISIYLLVDVFNIYIYKYKKNIYIEMIYIYIHSISIYIYTRHTQPTAERWPGALAKAMSRPASCSIHGSSGFADYFNHQPYLCTM